MIVSKLKVYEEMPTAILKQNFWQEWERVSSLLIRSSAFISDETLYFILSDLLQMHDEILKRKETIQI